MTLRAAAFSLCFLCAPLAHGQDQDKAAEPATLREAVDLMLSVRDSPAKLEEAVLKARALGAGPQAELEARFLFHVDRHEDEAIAALAPEFVKRRSTFKLAESEIFGVEEDWLAVVEYVLAIEALGKGDRAAFKRHITEAFWLSPRQGAAFAPHIDRLRLDEAMKSVRIDFNRGFETLDGASMSLGAILGDRKAILIHFFSPWSRECEEGMADFNKAADGLAGAGIGVATLIGESSPEVKAETLALLAKSGAPPKGAWLLDDIHAPLARTLRVQGAPTMVLVSRDGTVAFNGHPSDDRLWNAVKGFSPDFRRPAADNDDH